MDSTTDRRFTRTEVRLDEPHFDEEATLLSAQPVVPLEEVKAKTRSKARLALAVAIGGGLLIGLLAATLIYRFVGSNEPQVLETTTATEQASAVEQGNSAGGHTAGADETAVITVDEAKPPVSTAETELARVKTEPEPAKPEPNLPSPPKSRPVIIVRDEPDRADDEELDREELDREARRVERQEEKRQRRRAAREARREREQTTDDLLRIREIFEGAPRP